MTQKEIILNHLNKYGSITKNEGWKKYGFQKTDTIISELRASGYKIVGETVRGKNRFGKPSQYTIYKLVGENESTKKNY